MIPNESTAATSTPATFAPSHAGEFSATYSPEDNKLRLRAASRLSPELYARVRAAGFIWAPKQDLFVAPMWTPERETFLLELLDGDEIGDEDTSLVDRAEQRAERFDGYRENRLNDADQARRAVARITDGIPLGQPILIGHHSERHARRDQQRIQNGMDRAVRMWETSKYWQSRAAGALRHAKYKELPTVRARRIKTLESERRKCERNVKASRELIALWDRVLNQPAKDGGAPSASTLRVRAICAANVDRGYYQTEYTHKHGHVGPLSLWAAVGGNIDGLDAEIVAVATVDQAAARATANHENTIAINERWIQHYTNRIDYERALLAEAGATQLLDKKPKSAAALLPLLNYRSAEMTGPNRYNRGEFITYPQIEMTRAEYAGIHADYKGTNTCEGTHRFRTVMRERGLFAVFLTDSATHTKPDGVAAPLTERGRLERDHRAELDRFSPGRSYDALGAHDKDRTIAALIDANTPAPAVPAAAVTDQTAAEDVPADPEALPSFEALAAARRAGVQVVAVPQLFPTPPDVARRLVDLIGPTIAGRRVLEPSAGTGNLITAAWNSASGADNVIVRAVELNAGLSERLYTLGRKMLYTQPSNFMIQQGDFLALTPADIDDGALFDVVLMNPPFDHGADIRHIRHASTFLKPGGYVLAICANGPRQQDAFHAVADVWEPLPSGTFAGTNVSAALVKLTKAAAGGR